MTYYRLYFLERWTNRIREFREFEAEHDLAAIAQAAEWRGIEPMELWCRQRKVKYWGDALCCPAQPRGVSAALPPQSSP